MRRSLIVLVTALLGLSLSAQSRLIMAGVGGPSGSVVVSGGIGPVDAFTDLHGTTAGTTLTGTILNTGTHGNVAGGWAVTGSGVKAATHVSACGLLGTVSVDGTVYATTNTSLAMSTDNTQTLQIATYSMPSTGYLQTATTVCFTPNIGTFGGSGVFDVVRVSQNDGTSQIIQYSQSNCGGTAGFDLEVTVPATSASTCVSSPTGTSVWIMLLTDNRSGGSQMHIFSATGTLIGTKSMVQATSSDVSTVIFGNDQTGTSTGVNTFENMLVRNTGVVPYPLGPATTTQDPVYWIAKSLTNGTAAGTSIFTTKSVDTPAGSTVIAAFSSENDSMNVNSVVDTSHGAMTHCLTCDVSLPGNGSMAIYYETNVSAAAGVVVSASMASSPFRNLAVVVLSAGTFDIGAIGTTSSGADVTTAVGTPASNATCTAFGYITAGVAFSAGPNMQMGNTSSVSSFAFDMRKMPPISSGQTMTLVQANTSSKWISGICFHP